MKSKERDKSILEYVHCTIVYIQSYRHQICDFEMRVNEMLAIVALYYN